MRARPVPPDTPWREQPRREQPRHRAVVLLAVAVLAALSAGALLAGAFGLGLTAGPSAVSAADAGPADRLVAALNRALADGDDATLVALLSPVVVVRLPGHPTTNAAGLVAWLADLRAAMPDAHLRPAAVLVDPGRHGAAVEVALSGRPAVAGTPILGAPTARDLSLVLGFRDDRVITLAIAGAIGPLPTTLPPVTAADPRRPGMLTMVRIVLPPSAAITRIAPHDWRLLLVRDGGLTVTLSGPASLLAATDRDGGWRPTDRARGDLRLTAGDALLVPDATGAALRNAGTTTASFVGVALAPTVLIDPVIGSAVPPIPGLAGTTAVRWDGVWRLAGGGTLVALATVPYDAGCNGARVTLAVAEAALEPGETLPAASDGVSLDLAAPGLLLPALPAPDDAGGAAPALPFVGGDPWAALVPSVAQASATATSPRLVPVGPLRNAGLLSVAVVRITVTEDGGPACVVSEGRGMMRRAGDAGPLAP